ncbi:hypothetical protein MLD38_010807 [Melastoma candidum]|uniref:Uncharacterized protein n=1 Tax=Melastoma candidum TaxID=119954 RepID=A0ACB9R127_9MYRT|nr:hypothetical protein MLD38_010807 [Melastoma candidum]
MRRATMDAPLLEIEPRELRFTFEFKKQSTCSIRLINNSNDHVAFKVKTTAPKKYCVRPNIGIVPPKSTSNFMVTMQAQRTAPPDLICKDKFLLQSTVVPDDAIEDDITSSLFSQEDGRHVEETKLKVALMSPPRSPMLLPMNGTLKQAQNDASEPKEQFFSGIDFLNPERVVVKDYGPIFSQRKNVNPIKVANGEARPATDVKTEESSEFAKKQVDSPKLVNDMIQSPKNVVLENVSQPMTKEDIEAPKLVKDVEAPELVEKDDETPKLVKDVEAPKLVKDVESPLLVKDVESPLQVRGVESPLLVRGVESPKLTEDGKQLQQQQSSLYPTVAGSIMKDVIKPENKVKVVEDDSRDTRTLRKGEDTELHSKINVGAGDVVKDIADIKSQLNKLEAKLTEAEVRISKLTEDKRLSVQETQYLREELALLRNRHLVKQVQVGFPLLYVVMVALIGVILGYLLRSSQ